MASDDYREKIILKGHVQDEHGRPRDSKALTAQIRLYTYHVQDDRLQDSIQLVH
jgi:hypothetical protein